MSLTIMSSLVAKLRLPIVGRIVEAEETSPLPFLNGRRAYAVELHHVAFNMTADHVVANATRLKGADGLSQCLAILAEHHIFLRLCCNIASLQPDSVLQVVCIDKDFSRHSYMISAHQLLQLTALTIAYALNAVDDTPPLTLESFKDVQRLWQSCHREIDVSFIC